MSETETKPKRVVNRKPEPSVVEQRNAEGYWCQPSDESLKQEFPTKAAARAAIALIVKTGEEYRIIKISEPSLKARTTVTLG